MRITLSGRRGPVEMTFEVMGVLPGLHLVDCCKVTGDSVDFYSAYSQITDLMQHLITADALQKLPDEGAPTPPYAPIHASHGMVNIEPKA
jgi:hypothetical protein